MNFRVIFYPSHLNHSTKPPHLKGVAFISIGSILGSEFQWQKGSGLNFQHFAI